jgi:hypothetical protein
MEASSAEGHDRWRQVAMAGVRGVLIAASCCSPAHRGADGEALWSLKRESRPPSRTGNTDDAASETPLPGRVHVIGSSRRV